MDITYFSSPCRIVECYIQHTNNYINHRTFYDSTFTLKPEHLDNKFLRTQSSMKTVLYLVVDSLGSEFYINKDYNQVQITSQMPTHWLLLVLSN